MRSPILPCIEISGSENSIETHIQEDSYVMLTVYSPAGTKILDTLISL